MPVDIKRHSPSHTPPPMPVIPHREPASHGISLTLTIILMILAAIVSGGSVYYGQKSTLESESQDLKSQITSLQQQLAQTPQQQLPVPTPTTVASVAPSASPSPVTTNNFDITLAKVGDKVARMTIKAIEPFDKSKGVV